MYRVLRVNNTLDHNHEIVLDASLNFSGRNPDVRSPVLYRPISLAGQNTGHEMDQWRKTLYTGSVSDGRHVSVSSVRQQRFILHNSESWWFEDIAPVDRCTINLHHCMYLRSVAWIIGHFARARKFNIEGKRAKVLLLNPWLRYFRSMFKWNWAESGVGTSQVRLMCCL